MPVPSLPRDFFERIVNDPNPVVAIRRLYDPAAPTFETDWLDFKTAHPDPKQSEKKNKEVWSQALGGFANNQGGVLIWGIDARKTKRGAVEIDAACGEKPMDDPVALKSRLTELQRGATDPPLANVEIRAYELPEDASKGFVVCFIPEGPFKPYRSEQADQQWWLRAGDNFVVMSRAILSALFYPRSQAVFRVRARLTWELQGGSQTAGRTIASMTCGVELVNDGTATAKDVFVLVKPDIKKSLQEPDIASALWSTACFTPGETELRATRPMHPHRVTPLFTATWEVEAKSSPSTHHRVVPFCPAPAFHLAIFCENQSNQAIRIMFDEEELVFSTSNELLLEARPLE